MLTMGRRMQANDTGWKRRPCWANRLSEAAVAMRGAGFGTAVLLILFVGLLLPVAGSGAFQILLPARRWELEPFHAVVEVTGGIFALTLGGTMVACAVIAAGATAVRPLWAAEARAAAETAPP